MRNYGCVDKIALVLNTGRFWDSDSSTFAGPSDKSFSFLQQSEVIWANVLLQDSIIHFIAKNMVPMYTSLQ